MERRRKGMRRAKAGQKLFRLRTRSEVAARAGGIERFSRVANRVLQCICM